MYILNHLIHPLTIFKGEKKTFLTEKNSRNSQICALSIGIITALALYVRGQSGLKVITLTTSIGLGTFYIVAALYKKALTSNKSIPPNQTPTPAETKEQILTKKTEEQTKQLVKKQKEVELSTSYSYSALLPNHTPPTQNIEKASLNTKKPKDQFDLILVRYDEINRLRNEIGEPPMFPPQTLNYEECLKIQSVEFERLDQIMNQKPAPIPRPAVKSASSSSPQSQPSSSSSRTRRLQEQDERFKEQDKELDKLYDQAINLHKYAKRFETQGSEALTSVDQFINNSLSKPQSAPEKSQQPTSSQVKASNTTKKEPAWLTEDVILLRKTERDYFASLYRKLHGGFLDSFIHWAEDFSSIDEKFKNGKLQITEGMGWTEFAKAEYAKIKQKKS